MRPKEEKEKVLHVAAFLPLLVLLAGDQTSRSDGGAPLDHQVVVAHVLLLSCWTWGRQETQGSESVLAAA